MKKVFVIFIILFLPINIFAYSNFIIPGGESVGIKINSNGLVVVGFYKVNNNYIGKEYLKVNDKIISINNNEINSINDLSDILNENITDDIPITIIRNGKQIDTIMNVEKEGNIFKTGLYIKDGITGIGTLTYVDPITKIYGALGHEILYNEINTRVEVKNGYILESKVRGIDRSKNGYVGSKNANINFNNILGTINRNTEFGIYGIINKVPNKKLIEVASFDEIKEGKAIILTVTKDNLIREYEIEILDKYKDKTNSTKAFSFEVVDKELIDVAGGIVQGMSGSPILQNNKIIGGVTHVIVDRVTLGYGIFIKTMLEEGEKD